MSKNCEELLEEITPLMDIVIKHSAELAVAEAEVKLKKTKINRMVLKIEKFLDNYLVRDFDKDDKEKIRVLLTQNPSYADLSNHLKARYYGIFKEHQEIDDWKANVFFDFPALLFIQVSFPDGKSKCIDIIKSIKEDVNNIGHPLILKAIKRYKNIAKLAKPSKDNKKISKERKFPVNSDQAHYCLNEIAKALTPEVHRVKFEPYLIINSPYYDRDIFYEVKKLLRSNSVKNSRTISNKIMYIRIGLRREQRELDCGEIVAWLKARLNNNDLPRRCDENTLRNDFWAWKWNVKRETAKIYLSKIRKIFNSIQGITFDEKEIEKYINDELSGVFGIDEMPGHQTLSGLVEDENAFELYISDTKQIKSVK